MKETQQSDALSQKDLHQNQRLVKFLVNNNPLWEMVAYCVHSVLSTIPLSQCYISDFFLKFNVLNGNLFSSSE